MHGDKWHRKALAVLGGMAQKLWTKEEKEADMCDDITCMLLHWERPAAPGPDDLDTERDQIGRIRYDEESFFHVEPPEVNTGLKSKPTTTSPHLSAREAEEVCNQ